MEVSEEGKGGGSEAEAQASIEDVESGGGEGDEVVDVVVATIMTVEAFPDDV
eukprot:Awhi_evm1s3051